MPENKLLPQGTLLHHKYRLLRVIGQGGFGRTYLAEDESKPNKPRCAIKQFFVSDLGNNREQARKLFRQEAERLKQLGNHPHIPTLWEYFELDDQQYLVQEFIDGQNLEVELTNFGTFNDREIGNLLNALLSVLQFVHDHQTIHRDIKPANIIRRRLNGQLVLVDFGAAKYATATVLAKTGTTIGSAEYVSREQAAGKAVFSSDLYSLGVTCIYLLTGIPPFDLMDHSEDAWVWRDYLKQPVNEQLSRVLDRMLEGATKRRYQSAIEVIQDLTTQNSNVSIRPENSNASKLLFWNLASPIVKKVVTATLSTIVVVIGVQYFPIEPEQINQLPVVQNLPDRLDIISAIKIITLIIGFSVAALGLGQAQLAFIRGQTTTDKFMMALSGITFGLITDICLNIFFA